MMQKKLCYVVSLKVCDQLYFLLWQDGGSSPDEYVLLPGTSQFFLARTTKDLLYRATSFGLEIADQEPFSMDMDKLFSVLENLRYKKQTMQQTCRLLLDGWNMLEDMARSIGIDPYKESFEFQEILRVVYNKLFFGNNIPSLTPEGQSYTPLFSSIEKNKMKKYLYRLWHEIMELSAQFSGK